MPRRQRHGGTGHGVSGLLLSLSFEHDIRPLFRSEDIESMLGLIDLSSYQDVRSNADKIYEKLSNGSMPCDEAWLAERVQLFESWIGAGYLR